MNQTEEIQSSQKQAATKPGYKKTKLGWIPEEWEECTLESTKSKERWSITGGPFGSNLKVSHYVKSGGVGVLQLQNIGDGQFRGSAEIRTSIEKADELKSCNIYPGDIIISKMGDPVARACFIPNSEPRFVMASDGIRLKIDSEEWNEMYVLSLLNSPTVRKFAIRWSIGSTRKRIGLDDLKKLPFCQPPLPEQRAIARILSTWDKAIDTLQKLIAKKQERKKGLMQQLLSGKLRFAGFDKEWREYRLGEVANFRRGSFPQPYGLPKWYDDENGMPFIQVYDVDDNKKLKPDTKRKISKLGAESSVFVPKGTIVLTIQGSIGRIALTQYDSYVDRTLLIFKSFKVKIDTVFFMHVVHLLFEREKERAPGGTIKTITKDKLTDFTLKLPSFEEQKKIASLLSSADREIEKLQKQLEKMQGQKKGLMQKLLSGEVRTSKLE